MVCSAILPNEVLGFFSIKSDAVIGFVVPTASPLMVRFESCNGASKKFLSESIFSVLLTRAALFLLFYYIDALSHCLLFMKSFIDHTHWNPISFLFFFLLAIIPPFIYIPFVLLHSLESGFFCREKNAVATTI